MDVKRTRKQIIVDTGTKQHKLTLDDFKEAFGEKKLKLYFVQWEIAENYIVFEGLVPGAIKGISIRRAVFDTQKGAFTRERIGILVKKSETPSLMVELEVNNQKHEILWEDVRKLFGVKKFKARSILFESIDSVFFFQLWDLTRAYKFAYNPKTKEISSDVYEIDKILTSPEKKKAKTLLDYLQHGVLLRY